MDSVSTNGTTPTAPKQRLGAANPNVPSKRQRRRFSIEEKARIVREADACGPGMTGALLRREGIYSSLLSNWRRERDHGEYDVGTRRERAQSSRDTKAAIERIAELEREVRSLRRKVARAELIREIQKKAAGLLGLDLESPESIDEG